MERKNLIYALLLVTPVTLFCWDPFRDIDEYFRDFHERFVQQQRRWVHDVNEFFGSDDKDKKDAKEVVVWDKDVSKAHEVTIKNDEKGYLLSVSNLSVDRDDLTSSLGNGVLEINWQQKQDKEVISRGKLRIANWGYDIAMDNKLIRETKDNQGKVLSSSSYRGYSHSSKNFDSEVDIDKAIVESHDKSNALVIYLPFKETRKNVEIKKIHK